MRRQVRVRVEGHQADVAGLRILHVPENVTGYVIVHESRIAEGNQPALDLARKVAAQEEFHRADRREGDPAGHPPRRAVVQKPFLDPPPVAELLCPPVFQSGMSFHSSFSIQTHLPVWSFFTSSFSNSFMYRSMRSGSSIRSCCITPVGSLNFLKSTGMCENLLQAKT